MKIPIAPNQTFGKTASDEQIIDKLRSDDFVNVVRKEFSSWSGRIDQAQKQRTPLTSIQLRRMEFEAAETIINLVLKHLG